MNLDTLVSFALIGAVVYYYYKDHVRPHLPWGKTVKSLPPRRRFNYRSKRLNRSIGAEPSEPRVNALNHGSNGSIPEPTDGGAALDDKPAITLDEMKKLAKAIYLLGQGKSQKESLETAFEVTKGGGKGWKRASELLALVMPE